MNFARKAVGMGRPPKTRIGILFGGRSGEHEVSLTSAASVISALDPEEFEIVAIGITKHGELASTSELQKMLPASLLERVNPYDVLDAKDSRMRLTSARKEINGDGKAPEIVFPLLHGPYGEDGTIQGLLEIAGLPYIGCGVLASAVGMDKDVMKRLFVHEGLPVLPFQTWFANDIAVRLDEIKQAIRKDFGYPIFSKPANLGSSVGVRKIHSEDELEDALRYSAQFDRKVVVEKGIEVRELECAVLGNDDAQASVVGEIVPSREFYDYEAKYLDPNCRIQIPAEIDPVSEAEIRTFALRAFRAIDGSGLARVDFFLERKTNKVWLNEINTMPGFTPISMYSKLWAACGIDFQELVRRLVSLGFERHRERGARKVSA